MTSLAPGVLIAAPPMGDPNFDRSVVLLASHDSDGAFGWIVNGPRRMSVSELLTRADVPVVGDENTSAEERLIQLPGEVRIGGPVSQEQVWLLYPTEQKLEDVEEQFEVAPGICASASRTVLEALGRGEEVPGLLALAGYAGWAAAQLEGEIQAGGWLPGPPPAPELVFSTPAAEVWRRAYESLGMSPIAFTSRTVGSA